MSAMFTLAQTAYRFFEDGTETGSTALGTQSTALLRDVTSDSNIQLRIRIQESGGVAGATTDDYQLQVAKNGGAFANVTTTSTNVKAFASANLTDAATTTNRLGAGTGSFVAGEISETGLVTDRQITASNYSELLYSLTVVAADVAAGDALTFRLLYNGATFTYSVTPEIDVEKVAQGAGSAAGSSTASGTGTGILPADGAASGSGAASGTGEAVYASAGSAQGVGTASAVGDTASNTGRIEVFWAEFQTPYAPADASAAGSAAGVGTAAGVGASTAASDGSAAGTGAASGVGASTAAADGSAQGAGAASGVGASTFSGAGSAQGIGTATATGSATGSGAGAAQGVGTASATGASTAAADGAAQGVGSASAVGSFAGDTSGAGLAQGVGAAAATGSSTAEAAGSAQGVGSASGVGVSTAEAVGLAQGVGTATGIAEVISIAEGLPYGAGGWISKKRWKEIRREVRAEKAAARKALAAVKTGQSAPQTGESLDDGGLLPGRPETPPETVSVNLAADGAVNAAEALIARLEAAKVQAQQEDDDLALALLLAA